MILETILKWAIPFFLGTVVTATLSFIKNVYSKEKKRNVALGNAVQALLRNELVRRYREYEIKGEISILDQENIEHLYVEYKNLGGNGTIEKLYKDILNLDTKILK